MHTYHIKKRFILRIFGALLIVISSYMKQKKPKRMRLSIDLEKYPDVQRMFRRAKKKFPSRTKTHWVINALRRDMPDYGFGAAVNPKRK